LVARNRGATERVLGQIERAAGLEWGER
jgi:hypothetical protein